MASTPHYTSQLLRHALPLIPRHGFSLQTLQLASQAMPSTSTSTGPDSPSSFPAALSLSTLNALFPSPPPRANPSTRRHPSASRTQRASLTREQLIQQARDQAPTNGTTSRTRWDDFDAVNEDEDAHAQTTIGVGPLKALVQAWLEQGRKEMVENVEEAGRAKVPKDQLLKQGLKYRIKYNQPVVDQLVEALALLGAPTSTPLSSPSALLPFPTPLPHLEHVARIAHDLAKASGDESQGLGWYSTRASLGTLYGLSELHQLSPELKALDPHQRTLETYDFVDRMWDKSDGLAGVGAFATWVGRSWMGMGRSLGL